MSKVLIVDDVDYIRKSISRVLEDSEFTCDTCENGKIAIEKIQTTQYDLIITDIMMPEVDGFEFLEFLRSQPEPLKSTPVLAISGGSKTINSDMALNMLNEQANEILQKPFAKSDLLNAVARVMGNGKRMDNTKESAALHE